MSELVRYIGKIQKVKKKLGETNKELAKRILYEHGYDNINTEYIFDELSDNLSDKYIVLFSENVIYKILEFDDISFGECSIVVNNGGIIDFDVTYYNGGCGLSEAIESGIENSTI